MRFNSAFLTQAWMDRRDVYSGSGDFLGQRRHRQQRRRGPAGANGKRDTDFFRVTRSQAFAKLRQDIEGHRLHFPPNLNALDFQALRALHGDKDIVIKPADKGGAIVVMNKLDYIKEVYRQLNINTVYLQLASDHTAMIRNLIGDTLISYVDRGVIDEKTRDYLTKVNSITLAIKRYQPLRTLNSKYFSIYWPTRYQDIFLSCIQLPWNFKYYLKLKKKLEHPPGRPIVTSMESILSPLAIFLEKILTPIIHKLPSFLLDTGDFLHELRKFESVPGDSMLVSLDVKDLYTSISYSRGISSVRHLLINSQKNPDIIDLCLHLLKLVLTKNIFMFED
ncbi:unnamed protein product [Ranitomeya imitator]|uniref:Reverse transcriptase domain-containing protein n=1 Tax=Ranitomeya imitator TaxID=111125 RepID=A0ABN9MFA3_9NEOB|nr:unnamed protein product [Ranitomeya imitator]